MRFPSHPCVAKPRGCNGHSWSAMGFDVGESQNFYRTSSPGCPNKQWEHETAAKNGTGQNPRMMTFQNCVWALNSNLTGPRTNGRSKQIGFLAPSNASDSCINAANSSILVTTQYPTAPCSVKHIPFVHLRIPLSSPKAANVSALKVPPRYEAEVSWGDMLGWAEYFTVSSGFTNIPKKSGWTRHGKRENCPVWFQDCPFCTIVGTKTLRRNCFS